MRIEALFPSVCVSVVAATYTYYIYTRTNINLAYPAAAILFSSLLLPPFQKIYFITSEESEEDEKEEVKPMSSFCFISLLAF